MNNQQFFIAETRFGNVKALIPIRAKVYIAALPVAQITQDLLIVHREIAFTGTPLNSGWVVTHAETGFAVSRSGKTRKEAMEKATKRLLSLPASDSFERAINNARRLLTEYLFPMNNEAVQS